MDNSTLPLVSVIIPVYNARKTLRKAVQSVQQQTYSNWELILVDDASTDGSAQLCDEIAVKDMRIRVIHQQQNQGVEIARYTAIQHVEGDYVMFCDSDDWLATEILEHCVETAEQQEVDVVHFEHCKILDQYALFKKTSHSYYSGRKFEQREIMEKIFPKFFGQSSEFAAVWGNLYRKSLFDQADIAPLGFHFGEDLLLNARIMPHMSKVFFSDKIGYYYRIGGNTATPNVDRFKEALRYYDIAKQWITKYKVNTEALDFLAYELKNYFLEDVRNRILLRHSPAEILTYIQSTLTLPTFAHLYQIYAHKEELSKLNEAVKQKDAPLIYQLCKADVKRKRFRNRCIRIAQRILDFI